MSPHRPAHVLGKMFREGGGFWVVILEGMGMQLTVYADFRALLRFRAAQAVP